MDLLSKLMFCIFGGDEHNWYIKKNEICWILSNNVCQIMRVWKKCNTVFYIKTFLLDFSLQLMSRSCLLTCIYLAGLGCLYYCLLSSVGNKNVLVSFASVPGWYRTFWAMDNKRSAYATKYWKEGQKVYKCKMGFIHEIRQNKFLAKNCCIKCNGTIYIYKLIKNHLQYTAIPSAHVLWIRAKVYDLKSCIRTSLASAKVIL